MPHPAQPAELDPVEVDRYVRFVDRLVRSLRRRGRAARKLQPGRRRTLAPSLAVEGPLLVEQHVLHRDARRVLAGARVAREDGGIRVAVHPDVEARRVRDLEEHDFAVLVEHAVDVGIRDLGIVGGGIRVASPRRSGGIGPTGANDAEHAEGRPPHDTRSDVHVCPRFREALQYTPPGTRNFPTASAARPALRLRGPADGYAPLPLARLAQTRQAGIRSASLATGAAIS